MRDSLLNFYRIVMGIV